MSADKLAHPWPIDKAVDFRFRRGVWALARPWYGIMPLTALYWISPIRFWFPFFTLKTKYFHWYVGWKPIPLGDPKFYWRDLDVVQQWIKEDRLFVQLSWRWGWKEAS